MKSFFKLVNIYMHQLIRSKALWLMAGILALMVLYNIYYQSQFSEWLQEGVAYDIATRKAHGQLQSLAEQIRFYMAVFVMLIGAVVAPESRKNGTTQFVLSLQVSRFRLALAQFTALSVFIIGAVLLVHLGFSVFALQVGFMGFGDVLLGWIPFLLPLLMGAAVSFSLSLTFSTVVVYLIVFGLPLIVFNLIENLIRWKGRWVPLAAARLVDNLDFLMVEPESVLFWPFLTSRMSVSDPPFPVWTWSLLNFSFSVCFWILLGYLLYRNSNIGSRQALK